MDKFRYIFVLASGMADEPIAELGNRTPIETAHTPALDELTRDGKIGSFNPLPADLPASEEVALLSALGYDPHEYFSGEAGLAAAGVGANLKPGQLAVVHNLATEADGVLMDHAAGHLSRKEAETLLKTLGGALGRPDIEFHLGKGFSGVIVLPAGTSGMPLCIPPEQALGFSVEKCLPQGEGSELLKRLIALSQELFCEHDINRVRMDLGENPANILWPWGPGTLPDLPPFEILHQLRGAVVAAPGSARGLGRACKMHVPDVTGASGCARTDYTAKAQCALELTDEFDLVVLHVGSPAETSLEGNIQGKVRAIEDIDAMITAPLLKHVQEDRSSRLLFIATHVASVLKRARLREPVPLAMYGAGIEPVRHGRFAESVMSEGEFFVEHGHELLQYFLRL